MKGEINVLALVKSTEQCPEGERFIFVYDGEPKSQTTLLQTLGKFAADPELNFSWYDAAVLSQRVRKIADQYRQSNPNPHGAND